MTRSTVSTPRSHDVKGLALSILLIVPLVVGLITPALVQLVVKCATGGIAFVPAVEEVLRFHSATAGRAMMLSALHLMPFVVLDIWIVVLNRVRTRRVIFLLWSCGMLGALGVMVHGYATVWGQMYSGGRIPSTAPIAVVFIPIYCVGSLHVGLLFGGIVSKLRWFGRWPLTCCQACSYDLTGNVSGICPECGTKIQNTTGSEER